MTEIPVKYDAIGHVGLRAEAASSPTDAPELLREGLLADKADARRSHSGEAGRAFVKALAADVGALSQRAGQLLRRRPKVAPGRYPSDEWSAEQPRRRKAGRTLRRAATLIMTVLFIVVVALVGLMIWSMRDLPLVGAEEPGPEHAILLEASNGDALGRIGQFKIADAPLSKYPQHLIDAVLSIEDRRFYKHFGIDPVGIARAAHRNYEAGAVVEGGSTITQQLVKMIALDDERTYARKVREGFSAIWLELRHDKEEILARYLNTVYLGASAYGMPAAARLYFDKTVSEVSLSEAALLAGLIKAPSQYNPLRDLALARNRAGIVLEAMVANGAISQAEGAEARAAPAVLNRAKSGAPAGTWFADWAADEAAAVGGSFAGNIRVRTTLVPELQRLAEKAVGDALDTVGKEHGVTQAALVAMRADGAVLAMVGGRDYEESQFNRAVQAERQPGSAFKLFVYLAALRNGFEVNDLVDAGSIEIDGWKPENFGGEVYGEVTLAEGFAKSINTAAARLAQEVGIDQVAQAATDLGIDAVLQQTPSLSLGTSEVSLLDLTGAYSSVLSGRMPTQPWGILALGAEDQQRLYTIGPQLQAQRRLAPYQQPLTELLRFVVDRGTGRQAALDGFAAGKTGTSQNHRDAWFIGFDESLVVGVWAGNDDGTPMREVTGGSFPAVVWKSFMTAARSAGVTPLPSVRPPTSPDGAPEEGKHGFFDWVFNPLGGEQPEQCAYQACAATYRSFRSSDCTYQPYSGGRKHCEIDPAGAADALVADQATPEDPLSALGVVDQVEAAEEIGTIEPLAEREPVPEAEQPEGAPAWCNVDACSARYNSFRAADCTFQPFGGGHRQVCGAAEGAVSSPAPALIEGGSETALAPEAIEPAAGGQAAAEPAPVQVLPSVPPPQCNVSDCKATYASFRESDCTYQPLDGGPRRICKVIAGGAARTVEQGGASRGSFRAGDPAAAPSNSGGGDPSGGDPGSGDPGAGDPGGGDAGGDTGGVTGGDTGGGESGGGSSESSESGSTNSGI